MNNYAVEMIEVTFAFEFTDKGEVLYTSYYDVVFSLDNDGWQGLCRKTNSRVSNLPDLATAQERMQTELRKTWKTRNPYYVR